MIIVLLNWFYIFFITQLLGFGFCKCLNKFLKRDIPCQLSQNIICGIVIATVYAQFFSLFYKVGLLANLILLILCLITLFQYNKEILSLLKDVKTTAFSWEGCLYLGILILIAFFTSRGPIHADTNMYHAQAIRWYEEYGVVKGLANLQ